MSKPRLLLVDDHHLVLEGLRLELAGAYEIVGMLATGGNVLEECQRIQPDAVLLDLSLPDRSGVEVLIELHAELPEIKILIVTMHRDRVLADASLQAGALGFVPKDAEVSELRHAIREVLAGRRFLSPLVAKQASTCSTTDLVFGLSALSPRQREIVHMLGEGKSTARIAEELYLSPATITFHRTRIRKALGLDSEWGLTRYALMVRMMEEDRKAAGHA